MDDSDCEMNVRGPQVEVECADANLGASIDSREGETRTLRSLSVAETILLLRHLEISESVQALFAKERVDGRLLQEAKDENDFVEFGVRMLHARLLFKIVREAKQVGVPVSWLCVEDRSQLAAVAPPVQPSGTSIANSTAPSTAAGAAVHAPPPTVAAASCAQVWTQAYDRYCGAYHLDDAACDAWLEQQAAAGNEAAKGYLMLRMWWEDKDRTRAMHAELQREALPRWLQSRDATEQMHAECIMGYCYYFGLGCDEDSAAAVTWYCRSADHGHAEAQHMLGYYYFFGLGVPQDHQQTVSWWRKAADQGHAVAQCNLAYRYLDGQGVTVDHDEAIVWLRKAAVQGHSEAIKKLEKLKV